MTPSALIGDRFPALAPFATINAVRKLGTPARLPIAALPTRAPIPLNLEPGRLWSTFTPHAVGNDHFWVARPFAPSILEEATGEYFEQSHPSPFMLMTYKVRQEKRALIPAPTHVDGTGRLQTVNAEQNPRYWRLIKDFEKLTTIPVVLNTSFNDNEPVVCRSEEAIECFLRTKMDVLAIGNILVEKR